MAMTDMRWGLRPLFETEARKSALLFPITNNYGTALYVQDPALAVTAGTIERGSTSGAFLGSILGIYKKIGSTVLRPDKLIPQVYMGASPGASDTWFALVAVDPSLFYTMQEDGDTSSLIITDNFGSCDVIFTHAGNTTTGISGCELDGSSADNTATRPMQLVRPWYEYFDIDAGIYNDCSATGAASWYGKWICRIGNHQFNNMSLSVPFA